MSTPFSIKESLKFGWEKTRAHSGLLFGIMLILFAVEIVRAVVERTPLDAISFAATVAIIIFQSVIGLGFIIVTLRIARGESVRFANLLPPIDMFWRYFFSGILVMALVLAGLVLLIIPGIYFILRFWVVSFAIVDGAGVLEALKRSGELTEGVKWKLLGFLLVLALFNIAGLLFFVVGLLVTVPISAVANAYVYDKLKARHRVAHNL